MDLEEEAFTAVRVAAMVLAVRDGSIDVVWPSIDWVGVAHTIVASISQ
jgi:hypothetical protein